MSGDRLHAAVALHGWAWRTPLGNRDEEVLGQLQRGIAAAAPNRLFEAQSYPCRLAATIALPPTPSRQRKFLHRMAQYAVEVAAEALAHARTRQPWLAELPGERLGLFFGYGGLRAPWDELMPAMQQQQDGLGESWERGLRHLHPFFMLRQLSNNAQAIAAEELQGRGDGATLAGANAGAQLLVAASAALQVGAIDAALCVAYDSLLAPEVLIEQGLRGALTQAVSAAECIPPYADGAAGAVPGEAAAALLLTRARPNFRGGAAALCWLRAGEGADGAKGREQGPLAATLARVAAALVDRPVALVDGAAQAFAVADREERQALAAALLLTPAARLTATLAGFGQVGAAAPLVQTIALSLALRSGWLPAVAGLRGRAISAGPLPPLLESCGTTERRVLALSAGAPGLAGAVLVDLEEP